MAEKKGVKLNVDSDKPTGDKPRTKSRVSDVIKEVGVYSIKNQQELDAYNDGKEFRACDFRVGAIEHCKKHKDNDKLFISQIDIGFYNNNSD